MNTYILQIISPARALITGALFMVGLTEPAAARAESVAGARWATLEAIHQIENPRNSRRPGAFGELGAYQFRAATWALHTRRPFSDALDRKMADVVAVKHYDWICDQLEQGGKEASVYNVALAWNAGVTATLSGSAPRRSHDYARRVGNLAADLSQRTMANPQTMVAVQ